MNSITLMGRFTADPVIRYTDTNNIPVCAFCIAVKRPHCSDKTDFINCVAWNKTAEFIAKYFCKGKLIALCGVLISRNYEDKNGGKHTAYEVNVENAEFCGDRKDE